MNYTTFTTIALIIIFIIAVISFIYFCIRGLIIRFIFLSKHGFPRDPLRVEHYKKDYSYLHQIEDENRNLKNLKNKYFTRAFFALIICLFVIMLLLKFMS